MIFLNESGHRNFPGEKVELTLNIRHGSGTGGAPGYQKNSRTRLSSGGASCYRFKQIFGFDIHFIGVQKVKVF